MTPKASAARRRRRSLRDEVKALKRHLAAVLRPTDPSRFTQLVPGGGYNTIFALDGRGHVWEFRYAYDRSTKVRSDERWVPVPMERRDK